MLYLFLDPFVKVTLVHLEKPVKTKKTTFKKNTLDPVFNESISFNITPQQLDTTSLVITIWDYNSKSKDDFVGRIVLGKYATGPHESSHWTRMLQSHRVAVAQWHSMRTRQECDQVSPASIAVPWLSIDVLSGTCQIIWVFVSETTTLNTFAPFLRLSKGRCRDVHNYVKPKYIRLWIVQRLKVKCWPYPLYFAKRVLNVLCKLFIHKKQCYVDAEIIFVHFSIHYDYCK